LNAPAAITCDARRCPLCGQPNDCQLCTVALYKGPCWCFKAKIPSELVAQIPPESRNKACLCHECVLKFQRNQREGILTDEFYFEAGRMVFTAAYHLRRGYCCHSGCRHCPYSALPEAEKVPPEQKII
jgi:Family of unknown function (DUF5522)/Cysteine-rich CWC